MTEQTEIESLERQAERIVELEGALREAREKIEKMWREQLDAAHDADDDGTHVGIAMYHRNVARGLGEAMRIVEALILASASPPSTSEDSP